MGYDRIAKAARITKRNAALIVERLIEKGFVKLETRSDPLRRIPSEYRVLGYRAILEDLHRRGRDSVVRSGNGVLFVYLEAQLQTTTTVVNRQPTTVVATTTPLNTEKPTEAQTSSAIATVCNSHGIVLDANAERVILKRCRTYSKSATEEEIAHFTDIKLRQLRTSRNLGDPVGLLMTAVAEYFVEPAYELKRFRGTKLADSQQSFSPD